MKTLYLDCGMGAAGDMLTAALLELMPDKAAAVDALNQLGIPGVNYTAEVSEKCGILGTHMRVSVNGEEEESEDVQEAQTDACCCHTQTEAHTHEHCHHHDEDEHEHCHHHHHDDEFEHHRHDDDEHEHCHHHHHDDEFEHHHHDDDEHEHCHHHHHDDEFEHHHHDDDEHEHCHHHHHDDEFEHHHHDEDEHEHCHHHHHDDEFKHHHHDDDEHEHCHHHHHSGMQEITEIVNALPVSDAIRADVLAVYGLIAEAESNAHGLPVSEVHFHEVGAMDAIADVTAVSYLMHMLQPDEIVASPVRVGSGQVHCAHGILPVPAPATAYILRDVPVYAGELRGEMCTPTGAALLKHFVSRFGEMPPMRVTAIGYGMGKKDFAAANCVRAMLGEQDDSFQASRVFELSCNVDDMTAEAIGFAMDRLLEGGALDVWTQPIGMKKCRPATMLSLLCRETDRSRMAELLFRHTTTLGIRETEHQRYELRRNEKTFDTPYGKVRRKDASGNGVTHQKFEYDDLARIAKEHKISLAEAARLVEAAIQ